MQVGNFQSVKMCNWASKNSMTQTPLIGYFVSDDKRSSIGPFFLRREPPCPLWWNVADPTNLQKAQAALVPPDACGQAAPNWNVSRCRATPPTPITTSASSSMRHEGSKIRDYLNSSEFANDRPLILLGSGPKMLSFAHF